MFENLVRPSQLLLPKRHRAFHVIIVSHPWTTPFYFLRVIPINKPSFTFHTLQLFALLPKPLTQCFWGISLWACRFQRNELKSDWNSIYIHTPLTYTSIIHSSVTRFLKARLYGTCIYRKAKNGFCRRPVRANMKFQDLKCLALSPSPRQCSFSHPSKILDAHTYGGAIFANLSRHLPISELSI